MKQALKINLNGYPYPIRLVLTQNYLESKEVTNPAEYDTPTPLHIFRTIYEDDKSQVEYLL